MVFMVHMEEKKRTLTSVFLVMLQAKTKTREFLLSCRPLRKEATHTHTHTLLEIFKCCLNN